MNQGLQETQIRDTEMSLQLAFQLLTLCATFSFCAGNLNSEALVDNVGCQHNSTMGRDYSGRANTTESGIPCQKWSDTQPNDHEFTFVGDHNYCRNPVDGDEDRVWCITNDTDKGWEFCSVPFCPPLKVLDFSLDNDWEPDSKNSFTHASLQKENFPSSFTICMAFMVEQWGESISSPLFLLLDSDNKMWLSLGLSAAEKHTEYTIHFSSVRMNSKSPHLFFPMQWTRMCFSFNSNTSVATLVVDGNQLLERMIAVTSTPDNLNLILGTWVQSPQEG